MAQGTAKYDVLIIGGGPGGMSAALWCSDLGITCVLLDRNPELGGQLHQIYNPVTNYLGSSAKNGRQLLDSFQSSISGASFELILKAEVESIDPETMSLSLANGKSMAGKAIIVATGVRRRRLGVPGEDAFHGKGMLESGSRERKLVAGKRVVIVGGGDAAIENALILSEYATAVTVVHRRDEFTARREFLDRIDKLQNVEMVRSSTVAAIGGADGVEWVDVVDANGDETRILTDYVLIRIGVQPNSELVADVVELDERRYIEVDHAGRTSRPGLFAIGDVASPESPTISTAVGIAATAVKGMGVWINAKLHI